MIAGIERGLSSERVVREASAGILQEGLHAFEISSASVVRGVIAQKRRYAIAGGEISEAARKHDIIGMVERVLSIVDWEIDRQAKLQVSGNRKLFDPRQMKDLVQTLKEAKALLGTARPNDEGADEKSLADTLAAKD